MLKLDESQPSRNPKSPEKPIKDEFVILENVCSGLSKPCILDLKMGTRHYGEFADEEKRQRAIRKCLNSTSSTMGFRICGMQVYHPRSERIVKWDKKFGRGLNEASVVDAFRLFLWDSERVRLDLVPQFLTSLRNLLGVVRTLSGYRFYSSSLLLIYEGEPNNINDPPSSPSSTSSPTLDTDHFFTPASSSSNHHLQQSQDPPTHTDLRVIDFAKTYFHPPTISTDDPDSGFLLGLENIIRCLETLTAPTSTSTSTSALSTTSANTLRFSLSEFSMASTLFEMTRSASLSISAKHQGLLLEDPCAQDQEDGGDDSSTTRTSVSASTSHTRRIESNNNNNNNNNTTNDTDTTMLAGAAAASSPRSRSVA